MKLGKVCFELKEEMNTCRQNSDTFTRKADEQVIRMCPYVAKADCLHSLFL